MPREPATTPLESSRLVKPRAQEPRAKYENIVVMPAEESTWTGPVDLSASSAATTTTDLDFAPGDSSYVEKASGRIRIARSRSAARIKS